MSHVISPEDLYDGTRATVSGEDRFGLLDIEERVRDSSTLAFRVALAVLRQPEDAEDVAQEALLRAHRSLSSLRDRRRFRAWLVRMTFRLALDHQRGRKRRRHHEDRAGVERETLTPTRAASLEEDTLRKDVADRVWRAVDELPNKLRLVTVLVAMEEHTVADVAELLKLPEGTVKSRLHRARRLLAERLKWLVEDS